MLSGGGDAWLGYGNGWSNVSQAVGQLGRDEDDGDDDDDSDITRGGGRPLSLLSPSAWRQTRRYTRGAMLGAVGDGCRRRRHSSKPDWRTG